MTVKAELQPGTISGLMFQGFTNAFTRTTPPDVADDKKGQARWDIHPSSSKDLFGKMFTDGVW